jgi:hypothetical protein
VLIIRVSPIEIGSVRKNLEPRIEPGPAVKNFSKLEPELWRKYFGNVERSENRFFI